jgi:hypothetical protein
MLSLEKTVPASEKVQPGIARNSEEGVYSARAGFKSTI